MISAAEPRPVRLAVPFYGGAILLAAAISLLAGRNAFALGPRPELGLPLGAATACATVLLGLLAYRLIPALRALADEVAPQLIDGARTGDLLLLAFLSGVGEEALFRGALQPLIGLVPAALLFGLLHVGPGRRYLIWTASAVLAGLLFGALYGATGGILAPATAHALHNAAMLLLWRRSRKKGGEGL